MTLSFFLFFLSFLVGCGAYFNTFYNTKKIFNEAERKRLEQEKKKKKTGNKQSRARPIRINEYNKAIEKGSKVLELYPRSRYVDDALMIIGQSFYHIGDYIKAQRKFEELINLLPNSEFVPQARLWLGKTLIAQHDFVQARSVLKELVNQNVNKQLSGDAQMMLGELYFNQEDYPSAIQEFENTITKGKERAKRIQAQIRIGQCYIQLNDYKKAAQSFRKGLTFKPDLEQKYILELNYGQALRHIKRFDQALKIFEKMTREALTKEERANIHLEIAETLTQKGEYEKAKLELEDLVRNNPRTDQAAQAYYKLAHLYLREEGNFARALEQLELAQKEFSRSSVKDSIHFWLKNLRDWDKLDFESAVYQRAYATLDPARSDTTGNYVVEESEREEEDFVFPNFTLNPDSVRADSLRQAAIRDSVRADSLRQLKEQQNRFGFQNKDHEKNVVPNRRITNLSLNQKVPGRISSQQKQKKVLKKVTVPKSPTKLRAKLVESTNRMAELYFLQFNFPDSALADYLYLLQFFPDHPSAPHWLYTSAYLYHILGDSARADSLHQVILENYPDSQYALQILKKNNKTIVREKKSPEQELFHLAEKYLFEKEMMDSSIYVYQKIVEEFPESDYAPKSLYSIAYIYDWFKNDSSNALRYYRRLVSEYPGTEYSTRSQKKITAIERFKREQKNKKTRVDTNKTNVSASPTVVADGSGRATRKIPPSRPPKALLEDENIAGVAIQKHTGKDSLLDQKPAPIGGLNAIQKVLKYPKSAIREGITGTVEVNVLVNEKGHVLQTMILKSFGNKSCDDAAIAAVKKVRWEPGIKDHKPVLGWVKVPVIFRREDLER